MVSNIIVINVNIKLYTKQLCRGTSVSNMVEPPSSSVINVHLKLFAAVQWIHICKYMKEWGFKCEYCDYQIGDQGSLRKHITLVHKEDVYKCALCDFTANYKIQITNHSRNKH